MSDTYVLVHGAWHTGAELEPVAECEMRDGRCEMRDARCGMWDVACVSLPCANYCRAVRTLRGSACGALVRNGLMSSPPRRVYRAYTDNFAGLQRRQMSM